MGLPIFPGTSDYDQLRRIISSLGLPPTHMLESGKNSFLYFDKDPFNGQFSLKTREKYSKERGKTEPPSKFYFDSTDIFHLVMNYPGNSSQGDRELEIEARKSFLDLLRGLLTLDPDARTSPAQAMAHPFISGKPFSLRA